MSDAQLLLVVLGGWLGIGLALSLLMGRRGHAPWSWLVLGTLLGPLAVALAVEAWRQREERGAPRVVSRGTAMSGPVDVLVGVDGSPESRAAALGVLGLFGARLGRLTLARVISYDGGREEETFAVAQLEREARHFEDRFAETAILRGQPSRALASFAKEEGYEVVAIGTRGAGRTKALLGSAAGELARGSTVPVLLFSADPDAEARPVEPGA